MHGRVKQIQPSKEQLSHTMVVPREDMVVLLEVLLEAVEDQCPVDDEFFIERTSLVNSFSYHTIAICAHVVINTKILIQVYLFVVHLEMEDECELGVQTIKIYGESVGVTSVPEDAAKYLAAEVTFHLKEIIQDASKVNLSLVDAVLFDFVVYASWLSSAADNPRHRFSSKSTEN